MNPIFDYKLVKEITEHSKSVPEELRGSLVRYLPQDHKIPINSVSKLCPTSVLNTALLKHGKSVSVILDVFKRVYLPENPQALEQKTKDRKLSPLHVATISGNEGGVEKLIELGVNVNSLDQFNWAPIHHAALLGHKTILALLLRKGADVSIQTNRKATYQVIQGLVCPEAYDVNRLISVLMKKERERSVSQITNGEYEENTSSKFLEEHKVTQAQIFQTWSDVEREQYAFSFTDYLTGAYENYLLRPAMHLLITGSKDPEGMCFPNYPQMGVFSSDSFSIGDVIGEHLGEMLGDVFGEKSLVDFVECANFQNEIAQINDGFCNVALFPLHNIRGLGTRYILVSIEPILPGNRLCLNRDFKAFLKEAPYVEIRPEKTREFVARYDFNYLMTCYDRLQNKTASLEEFAVAEKLRYIADTPSVLFLLTFEGLLSPQDSLVLQNLYLAKRLQNNRPYDPFFTFLTNIAKASKELKGDITDFDFPLTAAFYEKSIAEMFEKYSFLDALDKIQTVNTHVEQSLRASRGFTDERFKEDLLHYLENMHRKL